MENQDQQTWEDMWNLIRKDTSPRAKFWRLCQASYHTAITARKEGAFLTVCKTVPRGELLQAVAGVSTKCGLAQVHFFYVRPDAIALSASLDLYTEVIAYAKRQNCGYIRFDLPVLPGFELQHEVFRSICQNIPIAEAEEPESIPMVVYSIELSRFTQLVLNA